MISIYEVKEDTVVSAWVAGSCVCACVLVMGDSEYFKNSQQYEVDVSSAINQREVSVAQVGCTHVSKRVKVLSDTCADHENGQFCLCHIHFRKS